MARSPATAAAAAGLLLVLTVTAAPGARAQTPTTIDGEPCLLPFQLSDGEVVDECADLLSIGVDVCPYRVTDTRVFLKPCAPDSGSGGSGGGVARPLDDQGRLLLDARTTLADEACLLPVVVQSTLYLTCAPNSNNTQVCPTASSNGGVETWPTCAPTTNTSKPFSAPAVLNRTSPGSNGQLCALLPSSAHPNFGCRADSTCFPLPENWGGVNVTQALSGLGACGQSPVGGTFNVYQMIEAEGLPVPVAHFPLTSRNLTSVLIPRYKGSGIYKSEEQAEDSPVPTWIPDSKFSSVVRCNQSNQEAIMLPNVPYADGGDFAISLWMRRLPGSNTSGEGFQYLFSHVGEFPQQVQILLGEDEHPAAGLVRVVVYDSTDDDNGRPYLLYLDSDGLINANRNYSEAAEVVPKHGNLNDGGWHMITLSTNVNGTQGFSLYVDGQEVGSVTPDSARATNPALTAPGGDSTLLVSNIFLCARSDGNIERFYDGSIAHLMLFGTSLTADQVSELYQQYQTSQQYPASADSLAPLLLPASSPGASIQPFIGTETTQAATSSPSTTPVSISGSTTATSGNSSSDSSSSGLSGGAVAGIVIGCICAAALVVGAVVLARRRRNDPSDGAASGPGSPASMGSVPSGRLGPLQRAISHMSSGGGSRFERFEEEPPFPPGAGIEAGRPSGSIMRDGSRYNPETGTMQLASFSSPAGPPPPPPPGL